MSLPEVTHKITSKPTGERSGTWPADRRLSNPADTGLAVLTTSVIPYGTASRIITPQETGNRLQAIKRSVKTQLLNCTGFLWL